MISVLSTPLWVGSRIYRANASGGPLRRAFSSHKIVGHGWERDQIRSYCQKWGLSTIHDTGGASTGG